MTRKEQKEKRRMQIIQTALLLFVRQGYHATKTSQISREAKMSEGLLFYYFPSKEDLLEELVRIGAEGMRYPLTMEVQEPLAFFRQFAVQLFQYLQENSFMANLFVLMAQVIRTEGIPPRIKELAQSVDTILATREMIVAGQKDGSIRDGDAYALSNLYWCCIQGIAEQYALYPGIPLPEPEWVIAVLKRE